MSHVTRVQTAPGSFERGVSGSARSVVEAGLLVQKVAVSTQNLVHVWRAARVLYDPWLCWLLMGLSLSLSARLFEWISSFTKADSGDDHVPLYPKGSQAPSSQ